VSRVGSTYFSRRSFLIVGRMGREMFFYHALYVSKAMRRIFRMFTAVYFRWGRGCDGGGDDVSAGAGAVGGWAIDGVCRHL